MTATEIELAIALHFGYRKNATVPNVSWGMGLRYEADMVILRPSDYAIEVEIKVSAGDIVADTRKAVQHSSNLFRELWFAVPDTLANHLAIPERAGILSVRVHRGKLAVTVTRKSKINKSALKWTADQRLKLMELGLMRIWKLKKKLHALLDKEHIVGR